MAWIVVHMFIDRGVKGIDGTNLISDIMHMVKEKGKTLNSGILPQKIC